MAIVGLKMVKLALVDAKTQQIIKGEQGLSTDGLLAVDSSMLGTKTANISNMEGQATKISGNNAVQDVLIAPGSPTVALDFNNLDFGVHVADKAKEENSPLRKLIKGQVGRMFGASILANICTE